MVVGTSKVKKEIVSLLDQENLQGWRLLMGAFEGVYQGLEKSLIKDGISYSRFQILFLLYTEDYMAPVDLARKLLVTRANISTFLKRMSHDELIMECPQSKSSKRPCFRLAPKGIKLFEGIFPKHVERISSLMIPFSSKTLADLQKLKQHSLEHS